jgi:hypothetical protein
MKLAIRTAGLLTGLLLLVPGVMHAQQATSSPTMAMTHLRVDITLTEYNGDKKISSLPYTMYIGVRDKDHSAAKESLRMGVRVPIATNAEGTQFNYDSVGTNIDCWANLQEDGRYQVQGEISRSSIYTADDNGSSNEQARIVGGHPILRNFDSGFDLVLRDDETGEGISATDPFNGHVLKVSVTIHVVK